MHICAGVTRPPGPGLSVELGGKKPAAGGRPAAAPWTLAWGECGGLGSGTDRRECPLQGSAVPCTQDAGNRGKRLLRPPGLHRPHVEGRATTAHPAPGEARACSPVSAPSASRTAPCSRDKQNRRAKASGGVSLWPPRAGDTCAARTCPRPAASTPSPRPAAGPSALRGLWPGFAPPPSDPPVGTCRALRWSLARVFPAVSGTQQRSSLLAFYQRPQRAQTTYLAGMKTLPPPLKLESQEPSGPPGDSERTRRHARALLGSLEGTRSPLQGHRLSSSPRLDSGP